MPRDEPSLADAAPEDGAAEHPFAPFVRTLGRGPGRARALTRVEARAALRMVLRSEAEPEQVGAFLMLLRYRGEDPDEVAGLVEAARDDAGCTGAAPVRVDLDWPSYGAGRTRGEPWFLLAALALSRAGHRVLMHGSNAFSSGVPVPRALAALGLRAAADRADAARLLDETGFAYLPLAALSPGLDRLLNLRALLGLRSPINTVARLLDPFDARAAVDGVFHPPYVALHLGAAERLGRPRLAVLKGGGGEAERNPAKPVRLHVTDRAAGRAEHELDALPAPGPAAGGDEGHLRSVWTGEAAGRGAATTLATLGAALVALGASAADADPLAAEVWSARRATVPFTSRRPPRPAGT